MDIVEKLVCKESARQAETLTLIPSENYASSAVRQVVGSVLANKYSEGYPGKRYYQGNEFIDQIEQLAIDRVKKLFGVPHANVQSWSGSVANLAILAVVCQPGESVLSQHLSMGGHLSMGQAASFTAKVFRAHYYGLTPDGDVDWTDLQEKAAGVKPKIIFCGGTAFSKILNFSKFAQIADQADAYFVADISHIAGLVAGRVHPSPVDSAHLVMTTTHKSLRGPRGAIIMVTAKGLAKDPDLSKKIDQAVFPGLQGGPHDNNIGAIAVALAEASQPDFNQYAQQVVSNSRVLAEGLVKKGFVLIGGGSDNHLIWLDLRNKHIDGWSAAWGLEAAGIITNRQVIPNDPNPPYYPSGLRLGTPAVTTRGMKEDEMRLVAELIHRAVEVIRQEIPETKSGADAGWRKPWREKIQHHPVLLEIKGEVKQLCQHFPVP